MPFGEVMYRCNAHYCMSSVFRNRAVGLVISLALMQLFLFSFYLNGLHGETGAGVVVVVDAAASADGELLVPVRQPLADAPPKQDEEVLHQQRNNDIDRDLGTEPSSSSPSPPSPPPPSVGHDWTDLIIKSSSSAGDLTRKAINHLMTNKKPALDAVASAAAKVAASPSDAVITKLGLNLLASLAKSDQRQKVAARGDNTSGAQQPTPAPADDKWRSQYSNLAQMGLQMLAKSGGGGSGAVQDTGRMLDMAAQFMLLNSKLTKSGVDPQAVKSVMNVLKSAIASQKLDPRLVVTWMGRMMQMQQALGSGGAASGTNLGSLTSLLANDQVMSLINSAIQPSSVPDQSGSIYRRYVKMTSRGMPALKSKLTLPRLAGSSSGGSGGSSKVVVDLDFKYGIQSTDACQANTTYLAVVVSSAGHTEERQAARDTWVKDFGQLAGAKVAVVFVVGQTTNLTVQRHVEKEAAKYGDMIQTNVQEPVENVVFKTLAGLVWVHRRCPDVKQVLKVDDDVYVSAARMLKAMDKAKSEPSIMGHMFLRLNPHETDGKYASAKDSWPLKEFPRFMNGGGYVMSRSAVPHLLAAAQVTPVLPIEDVYVTGLCANGARVELIQNKSVFEEEISEELEVCTFEDFASWRSTGPADVLQTWNFAQAMKRSGEICVRTNKCARMFFGLCVPS